MPSINYVPLSEITYAERLKEYGYYNMFIGKWHLGHPGRYPIDQGFDEEYGVTNSGHPKSYHFPFFKPKDDPRGFNNKGHKEGDYLTDKLTDGAVDFIKNYDRDQPFLLSFWYYSVHSPTEARKDLLQKYLDAGFKGKYAHHHAMVEAMDESVGRVRQALKDKGIDDNTVIMFLSDQGGAFPNTPLSGGKKGGNTLGEGGARVPFMIYYPELVNTKVKNLEIHKPVQSIDVYPTLVEIASGKPCEDKQIQGVSLLSTLNGETTKSRNLYFFRSYEDQYCGVISGDWKLIKYRSGKFQLFNVVEDISEKHNKIGEGLDIETTLKTDLYKWEKEAVTVY